MVWLEVCGSCYSLTAQAECFHPEEAIFHRISEMLKIRILEIPAYSLPSPPIPHLVQPEVDKRIASNIGHGQNVTDKEDD